MCFGTDVEPVVAMIWTGPVNNVQKFGSEVPTRHPLKHSSIHDLLKA